MGRDLQTENSKHFLGGSGHLLRKMFFFFKDQVASDAVSGETQEGCCWRCWVLGKAQLWAGVHDELLMCTVPSQSCSCVTGLSAEPCECNTGGRGGNNSPRGAPARLMPFPVSDGNREGTMQNTLCREDAVSGWRALSSAAQLQLQFLSYQMCLSEPLYANKIKRPVSDV